MNRKSSPVTTPKKSSLPKILSYSLIMNSCFSFRINLAKYGDDSGGGVIVVCNILDFAEYFLYK